MKMLKVMEERGSKGPRLINTRSLKGGIKPLQSFRVALLITNQERITKWNLTMTKRKMTQCSLRMKNKLIHHKLSPIISLRMKRMTMKMLNLRHRKE